MERKEEERYIERMKRIHGDKWELYVRLDKIKQKEKERELFIKQRNIDVDRRRRRRR